MDGLEPTAAAARVMTSYPRRWWFAGGWAMDLFVGRATRDHADIEIGVFREDQAALREHLSASGWNCLRCSDKTWLPWHAGEWIRLTDFQLMARHATLEPREFEFFLDGHADGRWICRRHPAITVPLDEFTLTRTMPDGGPVLPFLRPEIQLLYKAKYHRPKDDGDFDNALPLMSPTQRQWLREALQQVHPQDPWLARL